MEAFIQAMRHFPSSITTRRLHLRIANESLATEALRRIRISTPLRAFIGFFQVLAIVSAAAAVQSWPTSSLAADFMKYICASDTSPSSADVPYLAQNKAVMGRMMKNMEFAPTGDVDRDFVLMMAPHHQGAIDMAQNVLRFGRNKTIKRIAQEIIITQHQEMQAMQLAVGLPVTAIAVP